MVNISSTDDLDVNSLNHDDIITTRGWNQLAGIKAIRQNKRFRVYHPWYRKLFKMKPIFKEIYT